MLHVEQAKHELHDFLLRYAHDEHATVKEGVGFSQWWGQLIAAGWQRGPLQKLLLDEYNAWPTPIPERVDNLIDTYDSMLCGECDADYIPRLHGEPTDPEQFVEFVYSRQWALPG